MEEHTLANQVTSAVSGRSRLLRFLAIALLVVRPALLFAEADMPDHPANYLMDNGVVFSSEKSREISDALIACARDYNIHIYILTLPTLNVMPSRARSKIDGMLDTARLKWFDGKAGAVMIFDHETALAAMIESEAADREFAPELINKVRSDPRLQYRQNVKARDQVAGAAMAFIENFTALRIQQKRETRRRWTADLVFGGILGAGLLFMVVIFVAKDRTGSHRDQASQPVPTSQSIT